MSIDYNKIEVFLRYDKIADIHVFPYEQKVKVTQYVDNFHRVFPKPDSEVTMEDFRLWLNWRTVDPSRANIKEYLASKGLEYYDRVALFRRTRGRMAHDDEWVRFGGETVTYDDIRHTSF